MHHTVFNHFTLSRFSILSFSSVLLFLSACKEPAKPEAKEIVVKVEDMDKKTSEIINQALLYAANNNGKIDDSITLRQTNVTQYIYDQQGDKALWVQKENWLSNGDTLFNFLEKAKLYGLFPEDYHFNQLASIRRRIAMDSIDRKDAALWSRADIMLTDAFVQVLNDVKLGRLPNDSVSQRTDTILTQEFFYQQFTELMKPGSLTQIINALEPANRDYHALKAGIQKFLDSASFRQYTYVKFPNKDTLAFRKELLKRLSEEDSLVVDTAMVQYDSAMLSKLILQYQKLKGLTADGKFGKQMQNALNTTDKDKFVSIAISLDRYKLLPPAMPEKYIWVNLPGYYLQLREADTVRIQSKIVCGKPITRTPVLTSTISNMVTYPQWTIPESIILKEILPGLKRDTAYLAKKGYMLIGKDGQEVKPDSIDWFKYKKGIPYRVVQGSGDDNALGILKFNFNNKYAVYLHDTNQRYFFSRAVRSLSHGCVRVQSWDKLAYYILSNDSTVAEGISGKYTPTDSVKSWLDRKEKHTVAVRNKIPLFIRYVTSEGKNGKVVFYEDIYGEDKRLREKYFAGK